MTRRYELRVGLAEGVHARPAAELAGVVQLSGFSVRLARVDHAPADAASILEILSLGLRAGERIVVFIDGALDEAAENLVCRLAEIFDSPTEIRQHFG